MEKSEEHRDMVDCIVQGKANQYSINAKDITLQVNISSGSPHLLSCVLELCLLFHSPHAHARTHAHTHTHFLCLSLV